MPLSIIKQSKLQKGENELEFKQAVVTKQGRELMAKLLAGKQTTFTKVKVSSTVYQDGQLENLTALTNIKQEATAQAYGNNTATISVTAAIENTGLQTGYYINTVGLYATDPDKGEILYSVSSAAVNGYMPPDTGVSKSGFNFKIYSEVGNASQVNLQVDPAAVASLGDIKQVTDQAQMYRIFGSDGRGRRITELNPVPISFKEIIMPGVWYITTSECQSMTDIDELEAIGLDSGAGILEVSPTSTIVPTYPSGPQTVMQTWRKMGAVESTSGRIAYRQISGTGYSSQWYEFIRNSDFDKLEQRIVALEDTVRQLGGTN